eukprot:2004079-Rhodomonas_salina.2
MGNVRGDESKDGECQGQGGRGKATGGRTWRASAVAGPAQDSTLRPCQHADCRCQHVTMLMSARQDHVSMLIVAVSTLPC